jgi:uncharacterized membrane protein YcaP (DUF421 family)
MAREHVSMDELHRALREHGITHVCDVALAVLEVGWIHQLYEIPRDKT